MLSLSAVVCFAVFAVAIATDVKQCSGKNFPDLANNVQLSPCKRPPCRLKKGTDQKITIWFTPDKDTQSVDNSVFAEVLGVPLPFVGVDGVSICDKIWTEDDQKASCPLKSGTKYQYRDSFPILAFYPSVEVKVKWALKSGSDEFVCFEVPARIV
ncbi:ecdysteroid-regulated 16 kDa protein-like isoform X2 [Anticarsia gemmatalis]|uniref:ecdysteroid-regulated 16 kDa protein-like isoform X2 n=1 Tax=Anticarsia gemmatalis TaxID=129554 RepID=UPI003F7759B2